IRDLHVTGVQTCALPIFQRIGQSQSLGDVAIQREDGEDADAVPADLEDLTAGKDGPATPVNQVGAEVRDAGGRRRLLQPFDAEGQLDLPDRGGGDPGRRHGVEDEARPLAIETMHVLGEGVASLQDQNRPFRAVLAHRGHPARQTAVGGLAAAGLDLAANVAGEQESEGRALSGGKARRHRGRLLLTSVPTSERDQGEKDENCAEAAPTRTHRFWISASLALAFLPASWPENLAASLRKATASFCIPSLSKLRPSFKRASGKKRLFGQVSRTF